ncbi:MAG: lysylphosphatidylglycerol synthase domain-containing protein, partial [bacterium]
MKQALKIAGFAVRLGLGLGIIAYLLYRIDTQTSCIDFKLEAPASVRIGTTYADGSNTVRLFVVLEDLNGGNILRTVQRKGTAQLAGTGTLTPVTDALAPSLPWTSWTTSRSGLRFLWDIISGTLARWPWVMSGFLLFLAGIGLVTIRWKLILDAQNLAITWARVFSISFVGVFFSSFMPGSVGGDLVRGYYT